MHIRYIYVECGSLALEATDMFHYETLLALKDEFCVLSPLFHTFQYFTNHQQWRYTPATFQGTSTDFTLGWPNDGTVTVHMVTCLTVHHTTCKAEAFVYLLSHFQFLSWMLMFVSYRHIKSTVINPGGNVQYL